MKKKETVQVRSALTGGADSFIREQRDKVTKNSYSRSDKALNTGKTERHTWLCIHVLYTACSSHLAPDVL